MAYASIDELQNDIVQEIVLELNLLGDTRYSEAIVSLKVKDAIREAQAERRYTSESDDFILRDISRFYRNIKAKAVCKLNRIGAEFEVSRSENGVSINMVEYERLSHGIIPIARVD